MRVPTKAKVEKVASKDQTRPVICNTYLRVIEPPTDSGELDGRGYLEATDSYKLIRVPVELESGDVDGFVPPEVLTAARKVNRHDPRIEANGSLDIPNGPSFPRPELGQFPNVDQLLPDETSLADFSIGVNARFLFELAQGLGTDTVRLRFVGERLAGVDNPSVDPARPSNLRPILVDGIGAAEEGIGLLMPIRLAG